MSDERDRILERSAETGDPRAKVRRGVELVRQGLGWDGQFLRGDLSPTAEYGVYCLKRTPELALRFGTLPFEFVRVPAGDARCPRCRGLGDLQKCPVCKGRGVAHVQAFYIGRYPVTVLQFASWMDQVRGKPRELLGTESFTIRTGPLRFHGREHHPMTEVGLDEVREFCGWTGARLPTESEWLWACLGPPDDNAACTTCGETGGYSTKDAFGLPAWVDCRACHGTNRVTDWRVYPWGSHLYPAGTRKQTLEVCTATDPSVSRYEGITGPVVSNRRCETGCPFLPAAPGLLDDGEECLCGAQYDFTPRHPLGVSWCGAFEMVGNVRELAREAFHVCVLGFAGNEHGVLDVYGAGAQRQPLADTGFRLALDHDAADLLNEKA